MNRLRHSSIASSSAGMSERKSSPTDARLTPVARHPKNSPAKSDICNDTVAMVLAGGRGSRLLPLTQRRCKPAVPFGGGYRIIDFTLSNCINSGIRQVGVLTQYEQQSLIDHLQEAWNFLRRDLNEFIDVIPALQPQGENAYQGTADAIAQNIDLLKNLKPKYTLILAADHIYKADYRRMIQQHIAAKADVTVACCEVPIDEAGQFGIVATNNEGRIVGFDEKPSQPQAIPGRPTVALASMGIYVFKTELLIDKLTQDTDDADSCHDFGSDVIPSLIHSHNVHAYGFQQSQAEQYWRDVGTLDAYYEANMQLLDPVSSFEPRNADWPIHTRVNDNFPARFAADSRGLSGFATDCIVGSGCVLRGSTVRHSVLFTDVRIDEQSLVENSLILPGAVIGKHCRIRNAVVDSHARIEDGTEIGYERYDDALRYRISKRGIVIVTADVDEARLAETVNNNVTKSIV